MHLLEWRYRNGTNKLGRLADKVGTTRNYLVQIAYNHRKPSPKLAILIEEHTDGEVSRYDLRPDIYNKDELEWLVRKRQSTQV